MQLMVIQDSDNLKIGEIEAQVGMELANGYKVVKVNDKSAIARSAVPEAIAEHQGHTEKFFDPASIFYTDAKSWGFLGKAGVDGRGENLAALMRRFERGEEAYKQYQEDGGIVSLCDATEQAGFNFAKVVQEMRKSAITLAIAKSITQ